MKSPAKPASPLIQDGTYMHTDGRMARAGQWPSTNWSVVFVEGPRLLPISNAHFERDFTSVEVVA